MRCPCPRLSNAARFLLPLSFASCVSSLEGLKELALPDQLHLYYEDQEADVDNRTVSGRGFDQDGSSIGVGLSWSLAQPSEPAPGITREDLRLLLAELRRDMVAEAAALREAPVVAASPAQQEAEPAPVEAAAPELVAEVPEPEPEEAVVAETAPPEVAAEPVPQQILREPVPEAPPAAPVAESAAASTETYQVLPEVHPQEEANPRTRIPIAVAGAVVAVLVALQLVPGVRRRFARWLGKAAPTSS